MEPLSSGKSTLYSVHFQTKRVAIEVFRFRRYMNTLIKEKVIKNFDTVVISTQHAEPLTALRSEEVVGDASPDETASSVEDVCKLIETPRTVTMHTRTSQPACDTNLGCSPLCKEMFAMANGDVAACLCSCTRRSSSSHHACSRCSCGLGSRRGSR